jgi:hypothetical protein
MEARVILCELLHRYEFELAEPTKQLSLTARERSLKFIAMNSGTMAPKNGIWLHVKPRMLAAL